MLDKQAIKNKIRHSSNKRFVGAQSYVIAICTWRAPRATLSCSVLGDEGGTAPLGDSDNFVISGGGIDILTGGDRADNDNGVEQLRKTV